MTDTPRREEERVVTLLDLDDHRGPTRSHAGSSTIPRTRRGTFASVEDITQHIRGDLAAVDRAILNSASHDMDCAIADDEASIKNGASGGRRPSMFHHRRNSSRSRNGSPSRHSMDFMDHRTRPRANTAEINQHPIGRADSLGRSSHRRKPTFSEGKDNRSSSSSVSTDTEAEEDVAYPDSDHPDEGGPEIDYEELDEFLAEEEEHTVPNTPAIIPEEPEHSPENVHLPSAAATPSDDAFDELEKANHRPESSMDRRASIAEPQKPLYQMWQTDFDGTIAATSLGGLLKDQETFKDLFTLPEGKWWWLDVCRASKDEITVLCKAFSVHRMTREDIQEEEFRDKVEIFNNYYFVAFRSFEDDESKEDEYLEPVHCYALVFRFGIITFCNQTTPHPQKILRRIMRLRDYMTIDPDFIAYALVDDITDRFIPVIESLDQQVDAIEDQVYTARSEDAREILAKIGHCRRKVMTLLRLSSGKPDVVKGFAKRCNPEYSIAPKSDIGTFLSDIQDHIITMRENLTHLENLLSRIHSNFLAQINIDNINSGNKTNKMLGKVTLFASIFVPMNIVTGLFGMNTPVPFGLSQGSLAAWFGIVGFIALFSVVCVVFFKAKRLI